MLRIVAEPFFDPGSEALRYLPEGPRQLQNHAEKPVVGWVDIQDGKDQATGSFNLLDLGTRTNRSIPLAGRPAFFAETTRPGCVLVGIDRRLACCDLATGALETLATVSDDERVIINDGLAVEGGVVFGTKDLRFSQPIAALYYFEAATRKVHTVLEGQVCSNGKAFLRDSLGVTLIDVDTKPKAITCYRLDAGLRHVIDRRLVIAPEALPGFPDGLRAAPDYQSVVVAIYDADRTANGRALQIRLSDGAVLCEWEIPGSPRVTCPEFLYVEGRVKLLFTTAVEGMDEGTRALAPRAGTLFVAEAPQFAFPPAAPPLLDIG